MKKFSALLLVSAFIGSAAMSYAATTSASSAYTDYAKKRQAREEKVLNKIDSATKKNEENKAALKKQQEANKAALQKKQEEYKKQQEANKAALQKKQEEAKKRQETRKKSIKNLKDSFKY